MVQPSATVVLADHVRHLKEQGERIFSLQTGDPDFKTPLPIINSAAEAAAAGHTHYADSKGLPALREAIAAKCAEYNNTTFDPATEILVTNGGIHGYFCALKALLNAGDEVLIPDPSWPSHAGVAMVCGAKVSHIPALAENGFVPTLQAWEDAITPATRIIVINYPSNPTGAMPSREYLEQLNALAAKHKLLVLSDEVYEYILMGNSQPVSFASLPGAKERTITIQSFSKTYAMTGWRIGYVTAPADIIKRMLKISQYTITNVAPFIQYAAITALTSAEVKESVNEMVKAYRKRNKLVQDILSSTDHNIGYHAPEGGFYYFLDLRKLSNDSQSMSRDLLSSRKVAMVPGIAYGPQGEGFLRMTIAAHEDEIEGGLTRLIAWANENISRK